MGRGLGHPWEGQVPYACPSSAQLSPYPKLSLFKEALHGWQYFGEDLPYLTFLIADFLPKPQL